MNVSAWLKQFFETVIEALCYNLIIGDRIFGFLWSRTVRTKNSDLSWIELQKQKEAEIRKYLQEREMGTHFDLRQMSWLTNICFVLAIIAIIAFDPQYTWILQSILLALLLAMLVYFMHLYFVRIQASLMDGLLAMMVLGNVAGLVLTMPNIWSDPLSTSILASGLCCWVMKSLVFGVIKTNFLEIRKGPERVFQILQQLIFSLVLPLFLLGLLLVLARYNVESLQNYIDPYTQRWGWPLLISSIIIFVWAARVERRVYDAARLLLEKEAALSKT